MEKIDYSKLDELISKGGDMWRAFTQRDIIIATGDIRAYITGGMYAHPCDGSYQDGGRDGFDKDYGKEFCNCELCNAIKKEIANIRCLDRKNKILELREKRFNLAKELDDIRIKIIALEKEQKDYEDKDKYIINSKKDSKEIVPNSYIYRDGALVYRRIVNTGVAVSDTGEVSNVQLYRICEYVVKQKKDGNLIWIKYGDLTKRMLYSELEVGGWLKYKWGTLHNKPLDGKDLLVYHEAKRQKLIK